MSLLASGEGADKGRHLEQKPSTEEDTSLPRWLGWRLRLLVGLVLISCMALFVSSRWLSQQPHAPWHWQATASGQLRLSSSSDPALAPYEGWEVKALRSVALAPSRDALAVLEIPVNALLLEPSMRWMVQRQEIALFRAQHEGLDQVERRWHQNDSSVSLVLVNALEKTAVVSVQLTPQGWPQLGPGYWLPALLALMLFVVGVVVALAGVQWRNVAFLVLALGQSGHLYLMAVTSALGVMAPLPYLEWEALWRTGFDLTTGAALIQVAALHPRKMPNARWVCVAGWLLAIGLGLLGLSQERPTGWWITQGACLLTGGLAVWLMAVNYRRSPHPLTLVLRRLTVITLLTWALLSLAIGLTQHRMDMRLGVTHYGIMVWHVFFATQLLLSPYLSRSRPILQEFSLLAASSTVAAALDLLFVAIFSLDSFASMALSLFLALGVYLLIRRWVVTQVFNREPISTERLFERLYRMARELERRPDRLEEVMQDLLGELFDPLEKSWLDGHLPHCQIKGHGSILVVPLPRLSARHDNKAFVLQHADKGRRLFTEEDALLADRIVDQIDRAMRYDRAVEQGRSEERMRLAQDLHDDIGARLLTLMYQAPNASIEEYIRHTLQDLKTLTRGLAVQSHTLAEAASEWKRDVSHRLQVAHCELDWHFASDHDPELSVVQWSALTRILRELVNNTISHAKATHVQVSLTMADDCVRLTVTDNGIGRDPAHWTHGLGLGGVRKRVKQLGGQVAWREVAPGGISCEVLVPQFSGSPTV